MNRSERRRTKDTQKKAGFSLSRLQIGNFKFSQYPILIFFLKFLGVLIPFYVLWNTAFFKTNILAPWTAWNAEIVSVVLNLFGAESTAVGNMLQGPNVALEVLEGCDAIEPVMLLVAGLVAFPTSIRQKVKGILWGTLLLLLINVFRIISLYIVQDVWPAGFDFMHIEFWQVTFILLAVLIWYHWIRKSLQNEKASATSSEA